MQDLKDIRQKIDLIDNQLVALITQRLDLAKDVAQIKQATGGRIYDPARERELLNRLSVLAGPNNEEAIRIVYASLLSLSKARQRAFIAPSSPLLESIRQASKTTGAFPRRAMVACPGAEGAYSQQAVSRMFELPAILYFKTFEKVFDAVESGLCPYGVLPVENATAGSVISVFDTMVKRQFYIVKSLKMHTDHVLLGKKGSRLEDIRYIYSQPNALAQCSDFVKSLNNCEIITATNTAVAAKELSEGTQDNMASIASRECAQLYGLDILAENIVNIPSNVTRFICISKKLEIYEDVRNISLMLTLPDEPQALSMLLAKFSALNINITKLESRPAPNDECRKKLTIDFEASLASPRILQLLNDLSTDQQIAHFAFLGAYGTC